MGNSQTKEASETEPAPNPLVLDTESPYVRRILDARKQLTGVERVKLMFQTDEFGGLSPELQRIVHAAAFSAVCGGLFGAIGRGRIAHMNFMKSNAHEAFESSLAAKRKLQDSVTLGMGAGAWRIGWRITVFTTIYMSVATLVSTYRGKMGVLDQVAGAGLAGFVYKFPQGPKATVSGTVFGSLLGLCAGIITAGLTKLTGETIDTANLRYYQNLAKHEDKVVASVESAREHLHEYDQTHRLTGGTDQYDELTRFHDNLIAAIDSVKENNTEIDTKSTDNSKNVTQVEKPKDSKVVSTVKT